MFTLFKNVKMHVSSSVLEAQDFESTLNVLFRQLYMLFVLFVYTEGVHVRLHPPVLVSLGKLLRNEASQPFLVSVFDGQFSCCKQMF